MNELALAFVRQHWRVLLPSFAALALFGWQYWTIAGLRRELRDADAGLVSCQDREKAAAAVARAANAETTAQAFEAARIAAQAANVAHNRAESVRKGIDHAEDGPVAPVLRSVLDGLRGQ